MSDLIQTVEHSILTAIDEDKLVLPTLPEIALRVREVAQDDESSVGDLTRVISNDAAISARIIKVCNSPLLRASQPVENLQMAVNRLGMSPTADLATGLAMEQMFQATSDVIDKYMRDVWAHSTEVAGMCHILAQNAPRLSSAKATLAGLTHQIGILPILSFAEDNDHLLSDSFALDEVIEKLHPKLGEKILRTWDFSEEICAVPTQYLDFQRDSAQPDFVDLVMVANLQYLAGSNHPLTQMDWSEIPAFAKLGVDPYPEEDQDEEDLSENMNAALALLA